MGISPADFWGDPSDISTGMNLAEYDYMLQGFQRRTEMQNQLFAWHAAHIMNCWTGKGKSITADDLLGKTKPKQSNEEASLSIRERARLLKLKKEDALISGMKANNEDVLDDREDDFARTVLESAISHT